jgi:predicted metal-binding transcription factor (methanogenesis marker protein 9)
MAAALPAGDAERAIALSDEHFRHIKERLAEGLIERSEMSIEQALASAGHTMARKRPLIRRREKNAHC